MKKMLALTLMILSTFAFADGRGDPHDQTGQADFSQWQANIQAQAQKQQQQQTATADSRSDSRSTSVSGSVSNATGGAGGRADSYASGGSADNSVVVDASNDYDAAASSAASVVVGNCQTGGSGQTQEGGLSTVFDSAQCQALRQATAEQQLYEFYTAKGDVEMADLHLKRMEDYMTKAADAVDNSTGTKTVGGWFLDLIPVGVIAFLL